MSRLPRRQSGLPAEVSSLVGRGPEIAAVLERLRTARVVTLTGPGGCGKTRLALRVAALAESGFGDGARLVELAPLTDPALVPASVAQALGVSERDAPTPAAGLARELAGRELLVVLDNCEHVLGPADRVVVMLAGHCPGVRILATSRERLDVPGELVFPVPPLALPADRSAAAVAASEAGLLFAARAAAASPAFTLTAGNAAAVAQVCARLDGIPLAIELAAASARLWAPLSWPLGWTAIPGCCPAVRPARGGTGRWRRWSRGAMSCSMRPNAACWPACRCCAAGSTWARPNGWRPAGRCGRRRSPGCWPAWPASPSCASMTASRSVIRCWRPSASSPPAGWPPPARRRPCACGCWTGR